jgi:hypothetical protein
MAERVIDRQELVRQLRLPPRTVRRLVENYREWLSAPQSGRFTPLDLARLQIVARMSLAGRPRSAILDALATTQPAQNRPEEGAVQPAARADQRGPRALLPGADPSESQAEQKPRAPSRRTGRSLLPEPAGHAAHARVQELAVTSQGETEVAATATAEPLAGEIGKLREVILQNAERERQDRDRVLMALVRTQQEVSHLRSELGTLRSRRDRKRGVISRLFG